MDWMDVRTVCKHFILRRASPLYTLCFRFECESDLHSKLLDPKGLVTLCHVHSPLGGTGWRPFGIPAGILFIVCRFNHSVSSPIRLPSRSVYKSTYWPSSNSSSIHTVRFQWLPQLWAQKRQKFPFNLSWLYVHFLYGGDSFKIKGKYKMCTSI